MSPTDVDAITRRSKQAIVERMLGGELTHHLGHPPGGSKPAETTNHRNGTSSSARNQFAIVYGERFTAPPAP